MVSTTIGGTGNGFAVGRNQATLNIGLVKPQRAQAQRRSRSRTRSARRSRRSPASSVSVGFNRPIYVAMLGRDPEVLEARGRCELRRARSRKMPGIADLDAVGQAGPAGLRGAAQARRGARARPDGDAARVQPARLRQRRRRDLLDLARRRAGRGRAAPAAEPRASTSTQLRRAAGRLREGRHADRAGAASPTIVPVVNPDVIKRQDLQRRAGDLRRRRRAGRAATSAPTCRSSSRRRSCRPATASTSAARRRSRQEAFGGVLVALGAGGDLHLHRAGQPVRQLPAAARDHGLAAAGADRRDAGAAASRARRSTCSR